MLSAAGGVPDKRTVQYEMLVKALRVARKAYLDVVSRTGIDRLAKELVTVLRLGVVFVRYDADGIPIFSLPDIDMREKQAVGGAVTRRYNYQAHFAYGKYIEKYKKVVPLYIEYTDSLKLVLAYERKNPGFVLECEKRQVLADKDFIDRAAAGKAGRTK